ncbi:diguanylate cyclase (GGDEF)-like protein [Nakamurella sp. UYEF19]
MLFVDLDRLKTVNDTHGHAAGDELLISAGRRLTGLIRPGDTLGRLSGDEFVILCEDLEDIEAAATIAARLLTGLAHPFVLSATSVTITASIGIAHTQGRDRTPEELLDDADSAMYQAKREGGNRQQVFDPQLKTVTDHHSELERDLHRAAARGELHTAYQPIVTTADGHVTGFEALLRWDHPAHGPIPPATLIPLAEQSGLIQPLGTWVLQRACTDLHRWQPHSAPQLGVAVNVSAHQLMSTRYLDTVSDVIDATQTDPRTLTLEITESAFLADETRALTVLTELRRLGVKVALDDFGTGYAALNYLQKYPVDILKVDRSFVADLGAQPAAGVIIGAIVQLARGLGMTVIAEGVETAAQRQLVADLGCTFSQGFYFAKAMPAQAITTMLSRGHTRLPRPSDATATGVAVL